MTIEMKPIKSAHHYYSLLVTSYVSCTTGSLTVLRFIGGPQLANGEAKLRSQERNLGVVSSARNRLLHGQCVSPGVPSELHI